MLISNLVYAQLQISLHDIELHVYKKRLCSILKIYKQMNNVLILVSIHD